MPIQAQSADGLLHEFPDGTDPAVIDRVMKAYAQQNAPKPPTDTTTDILKSGQAGLVEGAAQLAGTPGDAAQSFSRVMLPQRGPVGIVANALMPKFPSTAQITNALPEWLGAGYQPETYAGRLTKTAGQFAPAALGAPSIASGLARVAAPTIGSQAGELPGIKGTALEPYASTIGALAASGVQGAAEGLMAERAAARTIPTRDQVKARAGAGYAATGGQPVTITPQMESALSDSFGQTAIRKAIQEATANRETAIVQELEALAALPSSSLAGIPISTEAADRIGQAFGTIGNSAQRSSPRIARGMFSRGEDVDTAVLQTPGRDVARSDWGTYKRSGIVEKAIKAAEDNYITPSGQGDFGQALRREFAKVVRSKDMRWFTPEEQTAIKSVANGTFTANTLQQIGKLSPATAGFSRWGELGAVLAGHGPEAALIAGVGEAAREGASAATARNARLVQQQILSGGTARPQVSPNTIRSIATTAAVAPRSYADTILNQSGQP